VIIGAVIRLGFILRNDFPLNDGGLFYKMTQELQANHYLLPKFTSYNQANIPFAYPPLPFYVAALVNSLFRIDLLVVFRFLPFVLNLASIPFIYFIPKGSWENRSRPIWLC